MKSIYVDSDGNEWLNGGTYTDASLVTLSNGTTVQADSNALHSKDTQIESNISSISTVLNKSIKREYLGQLGAGNSVTYNFSSRGDYGRTSLFVITGNGYGNSGLYMVCDNRGRGSGLLNVVPIVATNGVEISVSNSVLTFTCSNAMVGVWLIDLSTTRIG